MTTLNLDKEVSAKKVLVVDSTMEIKGTIEWTRAVTLVISNEAYTLIPRADGALVRSPNFSMPHPLVVCLNRFVNKPKHTIGFDETVSKKTILIRDNWTCQYCSEYGDTIDHIFPKSRGGGNTWGNLCVACKKCNESKADMTPKEAGVKTPIIPKYFTPKRKTALQAAIFKELENMMVSDTV